MARKIIHIERDSCSEGAVDLDERHNQCIKKSLFR